MTEFVCIRKPAPAQPPHNRFGRATVDCPPRCHSEPVPRKQVRRRHVPAESRVPGVLSHCATTSALVACVLVARAGGGSAGPYYGDSGGWHGCAAERACTRTSAWGARARCRRSGAELVRGAGGRAGGLRRRAGRARADAGSRPAAAVRGAGGGGVFFAARVLEDQPQAAVLIHCTAGRRRSAMLACAVLRLRGHDRTRAAALVTDDPHAQLPLCPAGDCLVCTTLLRGAERKGSPCRRMARSARCRVST